MHFFKTIYHEFNLWQLSFAISLIIIMFGMGHSLTLSDFKRVVYLSQGHDVGCFARCCYYH